MVSWREVESAAPEFAAAVRVLFDAHKHKTIATLRKDGSPRISGIEANLDDGEVWMGMMAGSLKAADVLRDPRIALLSASEDPEGNADTSWPGDAKLAGRVVEVTDPAEQHRMSGQPGHLFRVDLSEVVMTTIGDPADHIVIQTWAPGRDLRRIERR
jgi:hypothetical protein